MDLPDSGSTLRAHIQHRAGALAMDAVFQTSAPWTVIFGPSGSGKTTILRALAGLLTPEHGRAVLEPRAGTPLVLFDRAAGTFLPSYRRPVRTAAQRSPLFPGRTVRENVAYGAGERGDVVESTLEHLRLRPLADRRPERLSGGEQQRVVVARAIAAAWAAGPGTWLLLDEPFTGVDLSVRSELTGQLRSWLRELELPVLSVTHDISEVFALEAEVVRLQDGRVTEIGPASKVLARDRERVLRELSA